MHRTRYIARVALALGRVTFRALGRLLRGRRGRRRRTLLGELWLAVLTLLALAFLLSKLQGPPEEPFPRVPTALEELERSR